MIRILIVNQIRTKNHSLWRLPFLVSKRIAAAFYHIIKLAWNYGDPISNAVSKAFQFVICQILTKNGCLWRKFIFFLSWFIFKRRKWKLFPIKFGGTTRRRSRWKYHEPAAWNRYEKYDTKAKDKHILIFQWKPFRLLNRKPHLFPILNSRQKLTNAQCTQWMCNVNIHR